MSRSVLFYIRTISIIVIIVLIAGYSLFSARHIIEGPQLVIETPTNGASFTNGLIDINGRTQNISFISLNERAIFIDEQGNFREKLLLSPGYNIIKMYARDKFNREVTKQLEVVLNEEITLPIPDLPVITSTSTQVQASSSPVVNIE